jgi:hypothetical protein
MTGRGFVLILGIAVGAGTLPGCLRPFAASADAPSIRPVPDDPQPVGREFHPQQASGPNVPELTAPSQASNGPAIPNENAPSPQVLMQNAPPPAPTPGDPPGLPASEPRRGPPIQATSYPGTHAVLPGGQLTGPAILGAPDSHGKNERRPGELIHAARISMPRDESLLEAFRCILKDRPQEALDYLKNFDAATQDMFLHLFPAMAQLSQKPLDKLNPEEVGVLQNHLEGLLESLRPRAELEISRICYCEWIKAFGVYKPLPETHLFHASSQAQPGELVWIYVELRNFCSELHDLYHETRLSSSVAIRDPRNPNGPPIWYYRFDDRKQPPMRSRAPLHDYFNKFSFYVPHIPPGVYTLTIEIADETRPERRRVAHKSLEFRVTAMPAPER